MAELELRGITKRFGSETVLDNVTLKVLDKSFTAILGAPGAGKTTLLRVVAGVEKPDEGRVYLDGADVTELPIKDRNVAMIYQSYALYPHMKVYDNVANPLRARRLSKDEIDQRVGEVLAFLGIEKLAERFPKELSGGEAQRVAIARAMVRKAAVYLFDEPLTNLDYKIRERMRTELKRMCKEADATILYATPDPIDGLAMADYLAVLVRGKVEQYEDTRKVYDRPRNIAVATLFGSPPINMIDCVAKKKGDKLVLKTPFVEIDVTRYEKRLRVDSQYVIGLRPHYLSISEHEMDDGVISFKAKLHLTHVIGSETVCYAKVNDHDLTVHLPYIYRIEAVKNVLVLFRPEHMLVFDKEDGSLI